MRPTLGNQPPNLPAILKGPLPPDLQLRVRVRDPAPGAGIQRHSDRSHGAKV